MLCPYNLRWFRSCTRSVRNRSGSLLKDPGGIWMATAISWISIFRFPFSGPVPASHLYIRHSHCMQHTGNPPSSPCLMHTAWHRESLKLKGKFGTRQGFEICQNQFFNPLIPPPPRYFRLQNFFFSHNEIRVRGEGGGGVRSPPQPAPTPTPGDAELLSKTLQLPPGSLSRCRAPAPASS